MRASSDPTNIGFIEYLRKNRKTLKEASSALFVTILTSVFAGVILGTYRDTLLAIPGLIVLIPGILSMRGTIQGTLGSRLGSAFHLGLIKKPRLSDPIVRQNVAAAVAMSGYLAVVIGIYSAAITYFFHIKSVGLFSLIAISFVGTMLSMGILLMLTFLILFRAYSHGWDISTIHAPVVASFGDFVTIPVLLFTAIGLGSIATFHSTITVLIIAFVGGSAFYVLHLSSEFKRILKESLPVLFISAILSASSGLILQDNLKRLAQIPAVLALVPSFAAQGGNIGSVFASRLSSEMHLGLIKPKFKIIGTAEHEISHTYLFGLFAFPLIGLLTYAVAKLTGLPVPANPLLLLFVSLVAGALLSTVVVLTTFYLSIQAFKRAIDPDNILIPVVAGMADILGVVSLFVVLRLMGVL